MTQSLSQPTQTIQAHAFNISERLNLRDLSEPKPITTVPFTLAGANGGYIVLFRYGAVVFFDIPQAEEEAMPRQESWCEHLDADWSLTNRYMKEFMAVAKEDLRR